MDVISKEYSMELGIVSPLDNADKGSDYLIISQGKSLRAESISHR